MENYMKAFVSWSGGKDCLYAMYRFLKDENNSVAALVNMCSAEGIKSSSHGLDKSLIKRQSDAIDIPIIQPVVENNSYEQSFKKVISDLIEKENIDCGVFGDIYLEVHREWIERVCDDMGIKAVFPLWGIPTIDIINEFVNNGFKTIIVSVRKDKLDKKYLGSIIDAQFISSISSLEDIDPCGENGEFHSYVFDGPIFKTPVKFDIAGYSEDEKHWFLDLK